MYYTVYSKVKYTCVLRNQAEQFYLHNLFIKRKFIIRYGRAGQIDKNVMFVRDRRYIEYAQQ